MYSLHVKKECGNFYISTGNSKVQFVIVNTGAAMDCPSRAWCPFDGANHRESGRKRCYAQKNEHFYKAPLVARRKNEELIRLGAITGEQVAERIAQYLKRNKREPIVRLNESGDLAAWNIKFSVELAQGLSANGIKLYLYSKASKPLRDKMIQAGATVLHSERDFVAFKDDAELKASGAAKCSGICGPCKACPEFSGGKIGILEH